MSDLFECPAGAPGYHIDLGRAAMDIAKALSEAREEGRRSGRDEAVRAIEARRTDVLEMLAGVELAKWTEARLSGLKEAADLARRLDAGLQR